MVAIFASTRGRPANQLTNGFATSAHGVAHNPDRPGISPKFINTNHNVLHAAEWKQLASRYAYSSSGSASSDRLSHSIGLSSSISMLIPSNCSVDLNLISVLDQTPFFISLPPPLSFSSYRMTVGPNLLANLSSTLLPSSVNGLWLSAKHSR